jgi:hypothetical protein
VVALGGATNPLPSKLKVAGSNPAGVASKITFLETTELSAAQRQQVSSAMKKVDMYSKIMSLRQINAAGASIFDARLLLRRNGIFVQTSIMGEFKNALEILGKAQVERYIEFQHRSGVDYKESSRLLSDGEKVLDRLQSMVRTRLHRD